MKYVIINRKTGLQVGTSYKSYHAARRKADKLDANYGAYIHYIIIREVN